jgi:hypothetical protein
MVNPAKRAMSKKFKEFQDMVDYNHNTKHLKWKVTLLDFNTFDVEYLCFDSPSFIFWATCLNAPWREHLSVSKDFNGMGDDVKTSFHVFKPCFFFHF